MSPPTLSQTIVCESTFMSTACTIESSDICASAELLVNFCATIDNLLRQTLCAANFACCVRQGHGCVAPRVCEGYAWVREGHGCVKVTGV